MECKIKKLYVSWLKFYLPSGVPEGSLKTHNYLKSFAAEWVITQQESLFRHASYNLLKGLAFTHYSLWWFSSCLKQIWAINSPLFSHCTCGAEGCQLRHYGRKVASSTPHTNNIYPTLGTSAKPSALHLWHWFSCTIEKIQIINCPSEDKGYWK